MRYLKGVLFHIYMFNIQFWHTTGQNIFFNHIVKNIVKNLLQKFYFNTTSIKGSSYAFATWCHSAFPCVLANVQVQLL